MAINTQELQGQWNQLRGQVKQKWGQLTDDDLQIQGGNVDQLVGRIQQRTGEGREAIEKYLTELTSRGASSISQAAEAVSGLAHQAGDRLREGYSQVADRFPEGYDRAQDLSDTTPASRSQPRLAWASSPGSSWDWPCGHVEPHRGLPSCREQFLSTKGKIRWFDWQSPFWSWRSSPQSSASATSQAISRGSRKS